MGIFGFGSDRALTSDDGTPADAGSAVDRASSARGSGPAGALVERLMDAGIEGRGRFDGAAEVAAHAVSTYGQSDEAVDAIVRSHLRLAAAGGFVTSLGGFVTMPVALPANVVGFYVIATRMVASIASVRGYDIRQPEVRSAILLTLVGAGSDDLLKKAGYLSTGPLANMATQRLSGPMLLAVNKGIGFRLMRQLGEKSMTRFGKAVPLLGGFVGAGVDTYLLRRIAGQARTELPAR